MATALPADFALTPATTWAAYAGGYLFVCGTATAFLLADLLRLLADVIGLPAGLGLVILASPALGIGAGTWWAFVERRGAYSYPAGGLVGFLTALLTGLVWTARFVSAWGVEMVAIPIVAFLVVFVLGVVGVAGGLTGLPLMYARRRSRAGLADRTRSP